MPLLVVERGGDKGLTVKVEPAGTYVVGRENPQAAVKLSDPMASRSHFQIAATNGSWTIKDLGSRNGTLLNDEKLAPEAGKDLKVGDKIQVGETIFSFLSDEKEETATGLIGKTIGGYRLQERVGRGGMGTVYKAEQISLNRVVALKVLSSKLLSDPVFVEKFVQEARAAGGLTHPNIVQVIDVGSDRGVYFFSMEYMDHGSVGDIVAKEGPVPWERALEMMTDAAKGLIFAEKKGIIHRDIKPDNLMLTSEGTVKIGDLGLAKKADDVSGEGGAIFGTPHFIAPEQAQGKPVDNRADIYALGATFYRVLSGKTPFTGDNVKEILVKQVQEEPVPLQKVVPDLPDELAAVLGKMMKKRPDDRYRSAQGLFDDLERIRVMYHLEAHGQAASARRTKALAVFLGLAVIGLGAFVYHLATRPKDVEYRDRPGQNGGQQSTIQPETQKPDPEKLAGDAFLLVYGEEARLLAKLKGGPAETWRTAEAEWRKIAADFSKVGKDHPGTEKGKAAEARAKEIVDAIEKARKLDAERREAAKAAWDAVLAEADRMAAEGRFAAAVAYLLEKSAEILKDRKEFLPEGAAAAVGAKLEEYCSGADAKLVPLLKAVEDAAPGFPGAKYMAARKDLEAVRPGLLPGDRAKDPHSDRLRGMAERARAGLRETERTARGAARAALEADRNAYFRTYLQIRRWDPSEEGEPDPASETPFFAFRWDEALARWEALLKEMKTEPFRARVQAKIGHYRRCKRVFDTVASMLRDGKLDPGFPASVKRGFGMLVDETKRALASTEGVHVLQLTQPRKPMFLEIRAMTPRELYEDFLKRGTGVPFSAEDHLDLAVFLAEAGCGDHALLELAAAQAVKAPPSLDEPLKKWIEEESFTWTEVHGETGIVPLLEKYRQERLGGARPADLEILRKRLEDRIRELYGSERFNRTDYGILHHSVLGPDGPVPERLLPASVTDEVLRTLGVPGGPALAPEERPALPPEEKPADGPRENGATEGTGGGTNGGEATEKPK